MGNGPSRAAPPVPPRPKTFFLVIGRPSIRYIGDAPRGPLLFNVEIEMPEDSGQIDRAETVQLPVAVPSRQPFRFSYVISSNRRCGFFFSFALAMAQPGQSLRVLLDVDVRYNEGEGLHLVQSGRSHTPFCVFQFERPSEFTEQVVTVEALQVQRLRPAVFTTDVITGARRLTYAPLAIELVYQAAAETLPSTLPPLPFPMQQSSSIREPPSQLSRGEPARIVQYTFLDIPDATLERMKRQSTLTDSSVPASDAPGRAPLEAKVVRQMLQRGCEVYELDDVFNLDSWGEQSTNGNGDEEDDEQRQCVICLTNPKDTTLLPCRHMCLCYECASILQFQPNNKCPLCRAGIERILVI